ncbi:NAD-dependent succinate-semialdehyde dehydrogenase [Aureispira sp. CCB-QB1]|uniref:NAD-dependent succinate-semialdehyde dehydrogenase n=1 Tax=Aureispira sp. CCB-QB1 TaxID=1313421 RepID=UPI0006964B93|nr:NAD-dependent succinate-semialdehyde dehydrogenase [Aureispira sp. CCB-QB1]
MNATETIVRTINPIDNQVLKEYSLETWDEVKAKLEQSEAAFHQWKRQSYAQRAAFFVKTAEILEANKGSYAKQMTLEMGKPITQAVSEIEKCALVCRFYAENADDFLADQPIKTEFTKSYVTYQPLGTILQVMPWNFPFWQVFRFAAPALMAGNVTILKHASNVIGCGELIHQIFEAAGFPKGVFQHVIIDSDLVGDILAQDMVQGVALTGSVPAGKAVGELAGKNLTECVLELGGSDPFIVLKDADLPQAAKIAVQSRMHNTGQTCISAKRLIVEEAVADEFMKLLKEEMQQLVVGDPMDEATRISVMARMDLAEELQEQVNKSIDMGAIVEFSGGHKKGTNYFYPMLLSNVKKGMPAYEEELFGPVGVFFVVKNTTEAVALANDSIFGLAATVWSEDEEKAIAVAHQLEVGAVAINKLMSSDPRIPFGGVKQSGVGRELGREGILGFVNKKSVVVK